MPLPRSTARTRIALVIGKNSARGRADWRKLGSATNKWLRDGREGPETCVNLAWHDSRFERGSKGSNLNKSLAKPLHTSPVEPIVGQRAP